MSDGNGALPIGWAKATLADVTSHSKEKAEPRDFGAAKYIGLEHIEGGNNQIIGFGDVATVKSTKAVFRSGDVLYGKLRPYLKKVCRPDFDGICSTDILVFSQVDDLDNGYLLHFLSQQSTSEFATQNAKGINLPRISPKTLGEIEFPIPPLAEQRRIVSKIESLQERSSRAREALSEVGPLLELFRQSVLAAAFSGRLTADWRAAHPDVEPASELLSRIRTERRHRWEQAQLAKYKAKGKKPPKNWQQRYKEPPPISASDLPRIPESWAWATLDELTELITSGSRAWSKYYDKGDGTFIMAQNVRPGRLDFSEVRQLVGPPEGDSDRKRSQVRPGDLLVTIVGANTGDICPVENELPEHWVCQSVALLRLVLPEMFGLVLRYFLRGGGGRIRFEKVIYGQGRPHLGFDDLREMPVPIPPLEEQSELLRVIADREESMDAVESGLAPLESSLTQMDQSILAKAFRGELVPQDPRDEPASELLARIRQKREQTAAEKKNTKANKKKKRIVKATKNKSRNENSTDESAADIPPKTTAEINGFIDRRAEGNKLRIYIAQVRWPHPHTPEITWKRVRSLPLKSTDKKIDEVIAKVIEDKRYFDTCRECSRTLPVGHMFGEALCHNCAETKLGLIH